MEASKCFHEKSYSCTELHSPIVYLHLPMLRMNKRYTAALLFDKKESTMQTEGFYLNASYGLADYSASRDIFYSDTSEAFVELLRQERGYKYGIHANSDIHIGKVFKVIHGGNIF